MNYPIFNHFKCDVMFIDAPLKYMLIVNWSNRIYKQNIKYEDGGYYGIPNVHLITHMFAVSRILLTLEGHSVGLSKATLSII